MPLSNMSEARKFAAQLLRRPKLWLLLAALNIIPVLDILALGYFARVAAEVPQEPPPLRPLGRTFVLGLKVLAVMLVYGTLIAVVAVLAAIPIYSVAVQTEHGLLPIYDPLAELFIAITIVIFAMALLAALGVPIALIVAARRGVLAALNPLNSWRIIRKAGIGEYVAYLVVVLSFALLSFLPATGAALLGLAGYATTLIVLVLVAPVVEAFLWYWGGLMAAAK